MTFQPFLITVCLRVSTCLSVTSAVLASPLTVCRASAADTAAALEQKLVNIAAKAVDATVGLTFEIMGSDGKARGKASGSGVLVSPEGLILTAAHVVDGRDEVDVRFADGVLRKGQVLGTDGDSDLALVKVKDGGPYPWMEMAGTDPVPEGTFVFSTRHHHGYMEGRRAPVRAGGILKSNSPGGVISTTCRVKPGDSGGPLFTLDGKVIGINSGSLTQDNGASNHSSIALAKKGWERLLAAERWGQAFHAKPQDKPENPDGVDVAKLSKRLAMETSGANEGKAAEPAAIKAWLREYGMPEEKVNRIKDEEAFPFLMKLLGARPSGKPENPDGVDVAKLSKRLAMETSGANQGKAAEPAAIKAWLREYGMPEEKVNRIKDEETFPFLMKLLGAQPAKRKMEELQDLPETGPLAVPMEAAELEKVDGMLAKLSPSVVTFSGNGQDLVLGTVVRADGGILTIWSEIEPAKDHLQARLSDGRTFPAKVKKIWPNYDLAMVQIDAGDLPVITFPEVKPSPAPGHLLFSPGANPREPLLGAGVVALNEFPRGKQPGDLGIRLFPEDTPIRVQGMDPAQDHAADAGGPVPQAGDILAAVNGRSVRTQRDVREVMRTVREDGKAMVTCLRDGKAVDFRLKATAKAATAAGEGVSAGTGPDEFPVFFEDDQRLKPQQCGGPVVSLTGQVIGLNTPQSGRSIPWAIPSHLVAALLKENTP